MTYDPIAANALSTQLRTYYATLDSQAKLLVQECLLQSTGVKNIRNTQLWLTQNSSSRNFLNKTLSADEFTLRERIVKGVLRLNNENVPTKSTSSIGDRKTVAKKFADYMKDGYTGTFNRSIIFQGSSFVITYDTYGTVSDVDETINDEDLLEFE